MPEPSASAARCPDKIDGEQCTWPPHSGNVHRMASVQESAAAEYPGLHADDLTPMTPEQVAWVREQRSTPATCRACHYGHHNECEGGHCACC